MKKLALKFILIFTWGSIFAQRDENTVTLKLKTYEKSKICIVENDKGRLICDVKTKRPLDGLFKIKDYSPDYIYFKDGIDLIRYRLNSKSGQIKYRIGKDSVVVINSTNQPDFKFDNSLESKIKINVSDIKTIKTLQAIGYDNLDLDSLIQIIKVFDSSILVNAFNIEFANAYVSVKRAIQYDGQFQYCFDVKSKFRYELYYYPNEKSGSVLKFDSSGILLEVADYSSGLIYQKEIPINNFQSKHQYFENGKFKNEWID
jgi:hypothetical protein